MSSEMPSRIHAACTAWTDLIATARSHPLLTAIALLACTATSLINALINPEVDASARAIALGLGLAVTEAFLITPILLAAHRFVILGEVAQDYAGALTTHRFWRFFGLSAALVAVLYLPMLLTRWCLMADAVSSFALYAGIFGFAAGSLWLSLLFPAIAVDAPGMSARNAVSDLAGNVWRIFWAGALAMVPLLALTIVIGGAQAAIFEDALSIRLAFAPAEGAMTAATYVLLVLIASRFYLALGNQLRQTA